MSTAESTPVTDRISTTRVGASVWILRPEEELDEEALGDLHRAFREILARGARDVVIDMSVDVALSSSAAAALGAMADTMIARDGVLWISIPWSEGEGFTLKPIRSSGIEGLGDVRAALDHTSREPSGSSRDGFDRGRSRPGGSDERSHKSEET
jgi:hypothetical protein